MEDIWFFVFFLRKHMYTPPPKRIDGKDCRRKRTAKEQSKENSETQHKWGKRDSRESRVSSCPSSSLSSMQAGGDVQYVVLYFLVVFFESCRPQDQILVFVERISKYTSAGFFLSSFVSTVYRLENHRLTVG